MILQLKCYFSIFFTSISYISVVLQQFELILTNHWNDRGKEETQYMYIDILATSHQSEECQFKLHPCVHTWNREDRWFLMMIYNQTIKILDRKPIRLHMFCHVLKKLNMLSFDIEFANLKVTYKSLNNQAPQVFSNLVVQMIPKLSVMHTTNHQVRHPCYAYNPITQR